MYAFRTVSVFFDALTSYRAARRWGLSRREESASLVDAWRDLPAAVAPVVSSGVWYALRALRDVSRVAPQLGGYALDQVIESAERAVADAIDDACASAVLVPEVSCSAITIPPTPPVPRDTVPSESGDGEVAA